MPTINYDYLNGALSGNGFPIYTDNEDYGDDNTYYFSLQEGAVGSRFWFEKVKISSSGISSFTNMSFAFIAGKRYRVSIAKYHVGLMEGDNRWDYLDHSNIIIAPLKIEIINSETNSMVQLLTVNNYPITPSIINLADSSTASESSVDVEQINEDIFKGYVKKDGIPIANASVVLIENYNKNNIYKQTTDSQGYFEFNIHNTNKSIYSVVCSYKDSFGKIYTSKQQITI
jgi:hypothetical protein